MKLPFVTTCFIRLLTFSTLIFSAQAAAISQFIDTKSIDELHEIIYVGACALGLLVLLLLIQSLLKRRKVAKLNQAQLGLDQQTDTFPAGILHVNATGKIIYANALAATLLGRLKDNLVNNALLDCFSPAYASILQSTLQVNDGQINAKARASNLFLSLHFGSSIGGGKKDVSVICLTDENKTQRKLFSIGDELNERQRMSSAMKMYNIWVNAQDNTYIFDDGFAHLLGIEPIQTTSKAQFTHPLEDLTESIHSSDKSAWSSAIQNAKTGGHSQLDCRMQTSNIGENKSYLALSLTIVGSQNDKGECTALHIGITENTRADANIQLLDYKTQEHQAMLNASKNPIYAVDENGNILWSNPSFNVLVRHYSPQSKSKNLFELDFFPQEIKSLHQSSPGLSGRNYDMTFTLPANNGQEAKHLTITLSFYNAKNRLGDKTQKGIIGIINDITEVESAKNAVRQQQEQLDNMLNFAPVAIATIDAEDRIISANSVMSRRLGFSDVELKRQDFYELFDEPTAAGKAAKKLHQTGHLRDYRVQLKGKDKKIHPSELHVDIINREKQEYLCWIADKSGEQFQEDKFDSLLEHSSMPMAILGENGFSKLNDEACKFFCVPNDYDLFGVSPFSPRLNTSEESANSLKFTVQEVKASGKARVLAWEHKVGDLSLPCQATYVPLYKDQLFDSILCIWMDKREVQKADEARQIATNLHEEAERQVAEKQQLLATSQDQLATKMRTLADTEHKLQTAQDDLNVTQNEFQYLQEEHKNVTDSLLQLKDDYTQSRELLVNAQAINEDLNGQLASSSEEVSGLNAQREEIAAALSRSEQNYKAAQEQLATSEQHAHALEEQQEGQLATMHALVDQISSMKQSVSDKDTQIGQVSKQIHVLQTQLGSSSDMTEKLRQQLLCQQEASESAEREHRKIEETCQLAQAELRNKERHLIHLQSEMGKLEEMSNQEKGDMHAQQSALKQELDDKLAQLQHTQNALEAAQQAAEAEKTEKTSQQALLAKVKQELLEVEQNAQLKQQELAQKEKEQRSVQQEMKQKLWSELKEKQQRLHETESVLQQAKQQTEAEKGEKEKHRQQYEKLQKELQEIEKRNEAQQAKMLQSDQQWHDSKDVLKQEVEAKRDQLTQTKQALNEMQQQADKERLARIEQEQKLEQLNVELNDVATRANKQKEMLAGSDEQWRKHRDEIEQQKNQLQQALRSAQEQNEELHSKLTNKLEDLQAAESQVSHTQLDEQAVQKELEQARLQADALYKKLNQQEEKEVVLQHQLSTQQEALESKESSIADLQGKQKTLTDKLAAVQHEYEQSKQTLKTQHSSRSHLNEQMFQLEGALQNSKQQLADKESALEQAQQALAASEAKLVDQENALLSAHKQELQEANEQASNSEGSGVISQIESLPIPDKPAVWFDLLPYLQSQPNIDSLPVALTALMNDLESAINATEAALQDNVRADVLTSCKQLISLSEKINSDALGYLMASIQNDCTNGMVDNVSIRWPATKKGLQKTLRVVYSHLHV